MEWLLLILASAFVLSFYSLLLKRALTHEKNTQLLALYPLVPVVILPFIAHIDYGVMATATGWLLFLKAAVIALSIYMATLALERLPISIYAPMRNISPVFLLFLSWLLLGETLSPINIAGLLLVVTGALLLDLDLHQKHQVARLKRFFARREVFLLLLVGFLISFAPVLDRIILRTTDAYTTFFWYMLILAALFWIVHLLTERKLPLGGLGWQEYAWMALIGIVILVADILYFKAVMLPGTLIVVLIGTRRLSNLFATVFGGSLFHEDHLLYKGAMCLVMIAGTLLLIL